MNMSDKVTFHINFDKKEPVYTAGSTVSGKVIISPLESFECRNIVVSIFWSTHGKGNLDINELQSISSGPQRIVQGKDIIIPFSCQLPVSPLSYHGTFVNVDYYIKAKVDLALKTDPYFERDFLVLPGETYFPSSKSLRTKMLKPRKAPDKTSPAYWITLITLLAILTFFFLSFWFVFLILFIVFSYRPLMNKYAIKKTGTITVEAGNGVISPGKKLPLSLCFTPKADLQLNCALVILSAEEKAISGSGSSRKNYSHKIVEEHFELPIEMNLRKGENVKSQIDITIPDISAYSFDSGDNSVSWGLTIHIGIEKWPDWKKNIDLLLCPDVNIIEIGN